VPTAKKIVGGYGLCGFLQILLAHNVVALEHRPDDLARVLFPGNRNHQRVFLIMFVELKHAEGKFLGSFREVCSEHGTSPRMLETVRAKCRRLGLIDHVSRFNSRHGYREGWVFSTRFQRSLVHLAEKWRALLVADGPNQKRKELDCAEYI